MYSTLGMTFVSVNECFINKCIIIIIIIIIITIIGGGNCGFSSAIVDYLV